jgi:membrane protease YdiL (CAAX protease family)
MEITPAVLIEDVCKILALGVPVWLWLAWRWRSGRPLLVWEPRRPVPWHGADLLFVLAVFFLMEVFCISVGMRLTGIKPAVDGLPQTPEEQLVGFAGDIVARLVAFCIAVAVLVRRDQATAADLGFVRRKIPFDLTCGVIAFVAIVPIVYVVQLVAQAFITQYHHPLIKAVQEHPGPITWIIVAVSAVIVAPLTEEFFFRGLLQGWLEKVELSLSEKNSRHATARTVGEPTPGAASAVSQPIRPSRGLLNLPLGTVPILYSSSLFALTHLGQGAAQLPLFVLALVLGFLYQRTHRLLPSLVVHFLLNAFTMAMLFLSA